MIIEKYKDASRFILENSFIFPNQFVSTSEKKDHDYIKGTLDYFTSIALMQYHENRNTVSRNYDIYNGIFKFEDYLEIDYSADFLNLLDNEGVHEETSVSNHKHYPIVNGPIDTLLGEMSNRTNKERVKAIDELSNSEVFEYRKNAILQLAQQNTLAKLAEQGLIDTPQMETSLQQLQSRVKSYATRAEEWGNKTLKALKHHFEIKSKSEDAFRDYLIYGKEFHHFYEDNSDLGFGYRVENPLNCWYIANSNARTTEDCWADGTVEILTITEILDRFKLEEKEIEYLYDQLRHPFDEKSQYFDSSKGTNSIEYGAKPLGYLNNLLYSTASLMNPDSKELVDDIMSFSPGLNVNQTFVVVTAYFKGKEKIGEFTYTDNEGYERTVLIDDTIDKNLLKQGTVKWKWRNRLYKGYRIGTSIYNLEPLRYTDTLPLVGVFRRLKNTSTRSLLDLMKPYQAFYNVLLNQAWDLLDKEIGVVLLSDIRLVPKKDSEDPIETMLWEAKEKGIVFVDASGENVGGPANFNQMTRVDLTRSSEINDRLALAAQIRDTCWEMIGVNRQRMGSTMATETATSINTALSQSYSQTELWFLEHEYLMQRVLQTLLNTAQYVELNKPSSTLNYLNSELDNVFLKVNRGELLRKLFVFVTNSKDDRNMVKLMQELGQAAMQNGAEIEDIFNIMYAESERKIKDILTDIRERKERVLQEQNDLKRQELEQKQSQFEAEMARQENIRKEEMANENMNKQLDRELEIHIKTLDAIANESSFDPNVDLTDKVIEYAKLTQDKIKTNYDRDIKNKEISLKEKELKIKEKDSENKVKIAKMNKNKHDRKK